MKYSCDDIVVAGWTARFRGLEFPCSIGRRGLSANKQEGDLTTPVGAFRLLAPLYRPDRINGAVLQEARPLRQFDIWSDDPSDPAYNTMLGSTRSHGWRHEKLWRADRLYDLVIPVGYNFSDPVPGLGSAVFIHQWRSPRFPTAGCVAFEFSNLFWIASQITRRTRLIVAG